MCCGGKRSAFRRSRSSVPRPASSPPAAGAVTLEYLAAQPLRVQGPATGRPYEFSAAERAQAVEAADVASLLATRLFRRL